MDFFTVCLNPTLQKTLLFPSVKPDAVNRTKSHQLDVSGKGINVTRVLTQLGKKSIHLTQLGGDFRPLFLSLCERDGLSVEWVESNSQIRFCCTLLTQNNHYTTELVEESDPVCPETEERLLNKCDALLNEVDFKWLIVSGTRATGFSERVIPSIVCKAKEKGLKIMLDIKGNDLIESLNYEPDIVKPNYFEFVSTFGDKSVRDTVMDMVKTYRCRIVLTDGSCKIIAADGVNFFNIEFNPIKAINATGCGDSFTAGLASALEDGADFNAAIAEGCRCGGLNAGLIKPGVIR